MKSCPTCKRIYEDDTFTFCLDDGALLSSSYDPHSTLRMAADERPHPAVTEILPQAQASVVTQPARPNVTTPDSETLVYDRETVPGNVSGRPAGKLLIIGGIVAFALVGLVAALGYIAWRTGNERETAAPNNSSTAKTNNKTNTNVDGNTNRASSQANDADDAGLKWLDGIWEGTGYQTNPKSNWTMKLTARNNTFVIEYPSLSCRGTWTLLEKEAGKASFREVITYGLNRCENNGKVFIEKIDDTQISFKYSSPNATSVTSSAVLRKSTSPD